VNACDSLNGSETVSLKQQTETEQGFIFGQSHIAQESFLLLRESALALVAAVSLVAFAVRCGHKWWPKSPEKPRTCASCNSPYWDRLRKSERKLRIVKSR
jgi:NADH pyrophosphatase NudC (nudix superfamily)